jgi:alpha-tubulin suppressor-like RCC1 family protein
MATALKALARSVLSTPVDQVFTDEDIFAGKSDINRLSRAGLASNLQSRGLAVTGSKTELRERLLEWVNSRFDFEHGSTGVELVAKVQSVAKEESGSVYAVGVNHRGQLGMGDTRPRELFECIPVLKGRRVDTVSCGPDCCFAVTEDKYVYAWGGGGMLSLGTSMLGTAESESVDKHTAHLTPRVVDMLRGEGVVHVSVGTSHFLAMSDGGDLFAWGAGRHGQLGVGSFDDEAGPTLVRSIQSERLGSIAAGHSHSVALSRDGVAFVWGKADQGCLGLDTKSRLGVAGRYANIFPAPTAIPALSGKISIRQIACGNIHTVALAEGVFPVWSWGDGGGGRLGHGDKTSKISPTPIQALRGEVVTQVACGTWHSACIVEVPPFQDGGLVYTWGTGMSGQLGQGIRTVSTLPQCVYGFVDKGLAIRTIACGQSHNAALTTDDQLYTWGSNKYGCLGAELADEFVAYPQRVWAFDVIFDGVGRGTPRSIAVGNDFTIVACFPYAGPTEEEILEAQRAAATKKEGARLSSIYTAVTPASGSKRTSVLGLEAPVLGSPPQTPGPDAPPIPGPEAPPTPLPRPSAVPSLLVSSLQRAARSSASFSSAAMALASSSSTKLATMLPALRKQASASEGAPAAETPPKSQQ